MRLIGLAANTFGFIPVRMQQDALIAMLRRHRAELETAGMTRLSLFGSTARGEAGAGSDVDLAATFGNGAHMDLFRFAALSETIAGWVGAQVDLVAEPARTGRLQAEIDRDRVRVF